MSLIVYVCVGGASHPVRSEASTCGVQRDGAGFVNCLADRQQPNVGRIAGDATAGVCDACLDNVEVVTKVLDGVGLRIPWWGGKPFFSLWIAQNKTLPSRWTCEPDCGCIVILRLHSDWISVYNCYVSNYILS